MTTKTTTTIPPSTSSPSSQSAQSLRASLARDGYVLIPSLYNAADLARLRTASEAVTALARGGKWPYIRTLPKQFPPWSADPSHGIWGVQHLMHPELPEEMRAVFLESYFNEGILETVKVLLGEDGGDVKDGELIMELYNLLVRPDRDFELRWHRDDIPPSATPEEEMRRLEERAWHTQWNAALYDDSSLVVVPGSHARARTDEERNAHEYEKVISGMKVVHLKAGDVVFYNNNILHRGVYDAGKERMTLHGSVGHVTGGNGRARNVLQHGVGTWVGDLDLKSLNEGQQRAESMRANLVEMGRGKDNVGYSQEG